LTSASGAASIGAVPGVKVDVVARLTPRELEIVSRFDEGLADKEIALQLGIDYRTVKSHARSVYAKLGVRGRGEAAAVVRRAGLLEYVPPAG
jgi:DNA-binding NarL/FixJ family response regulator